MSGQSIHFGPFELSPGGARLLRAGEPVSLEPKVLSVLSYLIKHRDRVVPKAELLQALWPDEVVTEAVLPNNVAVLRRALGQRRGERAPIETAHGRGYRFAAPVRIGSHVPAPTEAPEPRLFGRDSTLRRLSALLEPTAPDGQVVLLDGAQGIGKTSVLDVLRARARKKPLALVSLRCAAPGPSLAAPVLWPFEHTLRQCATSTGGVSDGFADGWTRYQAALAAPTPPGEFERADVVAGLLAEVGRGRPMLWLIDDLHHADAASIQALCMLATRLQRTSLRVVATLDERAVEPDQPVRERLSALCRLREVVRLPLQGLSRQDLAAWGQSVFGRAPSAAFLDRLWSQTEGHPLLARDLIDAKVAAPPGTPPPELSDVGRAFLRAGLATLSDGVREVLEVAAVLASVSDGYFALPLLQQVCEAPAQQLLDALDAACQAGLCRALSDSVGRHAFTPQTRGRAVYEGLSSARRLRLHRRVAEILERQSEHADYVQLRTLAEHLHRALPGPDPRPAVTYACRAAAHATHGLRHADAAACHALALQALSLLPDADVAERAQLMAAHARSLLEAGQADALEARCAELIDLARRHRLATEFALAVRLQGEAARFRLGPTAYRRALIDEALSLLPSDDQRLRPYLLIDRARCPGSDPGECEAALLEAEALCVDHPALRLEVECARLELLDSPERADELIERSEQLLRRWPLPAPGAPVPGAQSRDSLPRIWLAHYTLRRRRCDALLSRGDFAGADRENAQCMHVSETAGWSLGRVRCGLHRVGRLVAGGDLATAERLTAELDLAARQLRSVEMRLALPAQLAQQAHLLGRPPLLSDAAVGEFVRGRARLSPELLVGAAWTVSHAGVGAFATQAFASVMREGLKGLPGGAARLPALVQLSHLCAELGQRDQAPALQRALAPLADRYAVSRAGEHLGPVAHALGRLHALNGEHAGAIAALRSACAMAEASQLVVPLLRAQLHLVDALLSAGHRGDAALARATLEASQRALRAHGILGLQPRVDALAARLPQDGA